MAKKKENAKPAVINKNSEQFLEKYLNNASPTGFEWEGQKVWLDYIKPYIDENYVDNYGTAVGVINPKADYRVVIEAHADEISWFVHYITKEGFIYVCRNGGSDHLIAPSMRVNIHTKKGLVKAVFGWPAIHTRHEKEETPSMKNIFLDCGVDSKEEVEKLGVHVGCVVTFEDEFMIMQGNKYVGRALDNRIGGFMIAEVARLLHENKVKLPYSLHIVNAVQEEIGLRGAQMIAERIQPHLAIVTDVCHDLYTPLTKKEQYGDIKAGRGPDLSFAPAVHNKFLQFVRDVADKNEIPYQLSASSRATGTDTDAFAYSNGGVPSVLISLPLKYMHTTVETVHKEDVEGVIELIYQTLVNLQDKQDFRYFTKI